MSTTVKIQKLGGESDGSANDPDWMSVLGGTNKIGLEDGQQVSIVTTLIRDGFSETEFYAHGRDPVSSLFVYNTSHPNSQAFHVSYKMRTTGTDFDKAVEQHKSLLEGTRQAGPSYFLIGSEGEVKKEFGSNPPKDYEIHTLERIKSEEVVANCSAEDDNYLIENAGGNGTARRLGGNSFSIEILARKPSQLKTIKINLYRQLGFRITLGFKIT